MFVDKKGRIKRNIMGHVSSKGLSVMREAIATSDEIEAFLRKGEARSETWAGVLQASVKAVRSLLTEKGDRAFAVYDTAIAENHAHAEVFQAVVCDESDQIELRDSLFIAFGSGEAIKPAAYRDAAHVRTPA